MKSNSPARRHRSKVSPRRWAAYATAAAATTVAAPEAAQADIWYSGPVNLSVRTPLSQSFAQVFVPLQTESGATFAIGRHVHFYSGLGYAQFGAYGTVPGFYAAGFLYASNLPFMADLETANFNGSLASYFMTMAFVYGYGNDQFLNPGIGYLGFKFDAGDGVKYGWARVNMDGAPYNGYTIEEYAYADAGDGLRVGHGIPEPGSLGLLAAGAVGLLAVRRARVKAKKAS